MPHAACVLYLVPVDGPHVDFINRRVAHEVLEAEIHGRRLQSILGFLGGKTSNAPQVPSLQNPASVYPPPRYPVTHVNNFEGRQIPVPVYGLHELLGEEKLAELVKGSVFEDARCVVLKGGDERTIKAQLALFRLLNFSLQEGSPRVRTSRRAEGGPGEAQSSGSRRKEQ